MANSQAKQGNTIIKDAIALFLITLVAGLGLGYVYQLTKDPIDAANLKKKQEAYQQVFAQAVSFEENADITAKIGEYDGAEITEVLEAKDESGTVVGYVMSVTGKEGYGGAIELSLGFDMEGTITGMRILSNSETAGLGARCTEDWFQEQFSGIQAEEVVVTKTGKSADNEIDAISGATITSKAVTKAVNAGNTFAKSLGA